MAYFLERALRAMVTVLGVVCLVFLLVRLVPGDPVDAILGEEARPEDRAALRKSLHLGEPLRMQFVRFSGDILDGTLGRSFRQRNRTVRSLIGAVMFPTVTLALAAAVLSSFLGLTCGALAALRRGTRWERIITTAAAVGLAIPNLWLGPLLILLLAVELRWFPVPGDDAVGIRGLVLPAVTVGTAMAAVLTRQTRAAMRDVLDRPFVVAAHARGLTHTRVFLRHGMRNALLPVLTLGGAQFGALVTGTVVAEKIFERPGLGTLLLEAFLARDIPVVQGCVLVIAVAYVSVNLLVDLSYSLADPRARLA